MSKRKITFDAQSIDTQSIRNLSDNSGDPDDDRYEVYADQFDPTRSDRKERRKRNPKVTHVPHRYVDDDRTVSEITDGNGLEFTYQPSKYERGWLLSALQGFHDQGFITDVLAVVKGGKEASVYRCAANPKIDPDNGLTLLAAKVYRPRMFRSLSNDQMYREGRRILTGEGRAVKETDHRTMRAVGKKSAFGEEVSHTSWLLYEYTTLQRLYQAGAAVPKPYAVAENAILMGYCGDDKMAAPPLSEVNLDRDEANMLFAEVIRNIELMLHHHMIHGDLSAFNILYWEGQITLIDFPQVTNSQTNSNAAFILRRDVERVCEYFTRQGVSCDSQGIAERLLEQVAVPIDLGDPEEPEEIEDDE